MPGPNTPETFVFGDFELDVRAYELRRKGSPVRLERQPMDVLILLLERRGELVSRADIIDKLWGKDVFVDVETGVHTAARKIRQALGDSAEAPTFLETVPGKGYRFIAPVDIRPVAPALPAASKRTALLLAVMAFIAVVGLGSWAWMGSTSEPAQVSIAVLPFENLSGSSEHDYLADGLVEDTIASLGQIDPDHLRVVGRTSSMAYKGTRKTLVQIGDELGVDYLLESSLRAESERVRVASKLIRVRDQVQMWSATYDRASTSVLGLQRELSTAIAEQIRLRLSPERLEALARRHTRNAEAYDAYLRGLSFSNQRTQAGNRRAIEAYERATTLDPGYALAWAALAHVYAASPINGDAAPAEVRPRALQTARQAVRADPDLAEAQHALGYISWILEWDWPAAETALRRAVALDRAYAAAHRTLGHCLSQMGRHGEALAEMRRARELDPLSDIGHGLSSQVAFQARDYPAAVEHARQTIVVNPELWIGYMQDAQAQEQLGNRTGALEALARAARFSAGNSKTVSLQGYVLAKSGRTAEARETLKSLEAASRERYVPPYAIALVHAGLGDRDAVFEWLERAYAAHDVHLMFLTVDPKWDDYRADPRMQAILKRCGFTDAPTHPPQ